MRLYRFDLSTAQTITDYNSERAAIVPLLQSHESDLRVDCIYLGAGGKVGMHQAVNDQLMLVVSGRGWIRTPNMDYLRIQVGQAVFWEAGELHETFTHNGMVMMVIEGHPLTPEAYLQPWTPD